jgi:hypothetical protein
MIEVRADITSTVEEVTTQATPEVITVSMIIEDLDNGTDRDAIRAKYNLEKWEVTEMFKHPALKGKKARKKRKMSFSFVDDTVQSAVVQDIDTDIVPDTLAVDPAQVDLVDSIAEIESESLVSDYTSFDEDEDDNNF